MSAREYISVLIFDQQRFYERFGKRDSLDSDSKQAPPPSQQLTEPREIGGMTSDEVRNETDWHSWRLRQKTAKVGVWVGGCGCVHGCVDACCAWVCVRVGVDVCCMRVCVCVCVCVRVLACVHRRHFHFTTHLRFWRCSLPRPCTVLEQKSRAYCQVCMHVSSSVCEDELIYRNCPVDYRLLPHNFVCM